MAADSAVEPDTLKPETIGLTARVVNERRRTFRLPADDTVVLIDAVELPVFDLSLGGFRAKIEDPSVSLGDRLTGQIIWRGRSQAVSMRFQAQLMRLEGGQAGLAFDDIPAVEMDILLRIMTGIEAERITRIESLQEAEDRRVRNQRATLGGAIVFGLVVLGVIGLWQFGVFGG